MAFARWDPIRDLLALQQHLDRRHHGPAGWSPSIDLSETEESYRLAAEVPGLDRADIRIAFLDGRLTIEGVRRETGTPCDRYHRIERGRGEFSRSFQLPQPVDANRIAADLRDGVLLIEVPKVREPGGRRIEVS